MVPHLPTLLALKVTDIQTSAARNQTLVQKLRHSARTENKNHNEAQPVPPSLRRPPPARIEKEINHRNVHFLKR